APDWVPLAAKMTALSGVVAVVLAACALFTIGYQLVDGYSNIEPLLYAKGLGIQLVSFVLMAALAVFFQVVTGNMFVGYVLMIAYLVVRVVIRMYDFDHLLYNYGAASRMPHSDMNGYGHFVGPWLWSRTYWGAFALLLLAVATAMWPRGTSLDWKDRLKTAKLRLRSTPLRATLAVALLAFVGSGAWIFYNTNVLNEYVPGDLAKERQADYEKTYGKYRDLPQPRITDIQADVDIFPEARSVTIDGRYRMVNQTSKPITDLHVTINPDLDDIRLGFPAHELVESDPVSGYRIYRLDAPLAPGAAMDLEFGYTSRPHGFPLNGGDTAVVYN